MAVILPVYDSPDHYYTTNIEGNRYFLYFKYNTRTASWYVKLTTPDGDVVVNYQKALPLQPLFLYNSQFLPNGNFYIIPSVDQDDLVITRYNFGEGKAFQLFYISKDELDSALALIN